MADDPAAVVAFLETCKQAAVEVVVRGRNIQLRCLNGGLPPRELQVQAEALKVSLIRHFRQQRQAKTSEDPGPHEEIPPGEPPPDPYPTGGTGGANDVTGDGGEPDHGARGNPWDYALSAPAFLAEIENVLEFLYDGVLMPGAITRINSPRGLGKTNIGHAIGVQLARAGKRVLLFDRDNPKAEIKRRLHAWSAAGLKTLTVLSREHAPALTDVRAWKKYPIGAYDVMIIDSWDASTEGVGEQDSAKPSKAQAILLDLAHREDGPAILVLANTVKSGAAGRGVGTLEDREDIVLEVRDATGFIPTGRSDWWSELPDASRGAWADRAARRVKKDRLRIACIYSKLRVGGELDPFILEVDFTTVPWTLRRVTGEVIAAGQAAQAAAAADSAMIEADAINRLRDDVVHRDNEGGAPYRKEEAVTFLCGAGLRRKQSRILVDEGDGTHWRLEQLMETHGQPIVLYPRNKSTRRREEASRQCSAEQGFQEAIFTPPLSDADGVKIDGEKRDKTSSADDLASRRREPPKGGQAGRKSPSQSADLHLLHAVWETLQGLDLPAPSVEVLLRGLVARPNYTGNPWGAGGAWTWDRHVDEGRVAVPADELVHLLQAGFGLAPVDLQQPDGTPYRGYRYHDVKLAYDRANGER
jgi:hypothetical protein